MHHPSSLFLQFQQNLCWCNGDFLIWMLMIQRRKRLLMKRCEQEMENGMENSIFNALISRYQNINWRYLIMMKCLIIYTFANVCIYSCLSTMRWEVPLHKTRRKFLFRHLRNDISCFTGSKNWSQFPNLKLETCRNNLFWLINLFKFIFFLSIRLRSERDS